MPEMWPDFGHLQEQFLSGLPLREMHLRRHGCRFHFFGALQYLILVLFGASKFWNFMFIVAILVVKMLAITS